MTFVASNYKISIDLAQNILYGYYLDNQYNIYKYPDLISKSSVTKSIKYSCAAEITKIAINNNLLYAYGSNSGNAYLWVFELPETDTSDIELALENALYSVDLTEKCFSELNATNYSEITDMIYQDGFVYLLLKDYETANDSWKFYSRGAVIKVDPSNGNCETLGWTEGPQSTAGNYAYIFAVSNGDTISDKGPCKQDYILNENGESVLIYNPSLIRCEDLKSVDDESTLQLFAPSGLNSLSAFYGPKKFIAIKPKELVISDEGIAFYTDSRTAYNYKNINRVVTVSLENFAITDAESVAVNFSIDATNKLPDTCCYSQIATASLYRELDGEYLEIGAGDQLFYSASTYTNISTGFTAKLFSHGIPCEENQIPHN